MDGHLSILGWTFFGTLGFLLVMYIVEFIVRAFRVHVLWGIAVVCIPFAFIFFLFRHWIESGNAFLKAVLAGVAMVFVWQVYPLIENIFLDWNHSWDRFF